MSDPLAHSRYSVDNAKRHIANLESEITAFLQSDPYAQLKQFDPDGPYDIFKLKLVKPLPRFISGIAFDAANNLRAALDQLGYAVAIAAGKNGKNAHFPFGDSLANAESRKNGRSKDIPDPIFAAMIGIQPYKGGNDLLWALNTICNSQKHETIIPTAIYSGASSFRFGAKGAVFPKGFTFPPKWDSEKNEMILAVVPHGVERDFQMQVSTFIAFAKVGVLFGQPAVPVLRELARQVEGIVGLIEAEARRIGLIV